MEFAFNEEQSMLADMVKDFAREKVAPQAAEVDKTGTFPAAIIREMSELGMMGITVPSDYEGSGMGFVSCCMAIEHVSGACASTGIVMTIHNLQVAQLLCAFGSDSLKKKYLPELATGKKLGAYAFTEPHMIRDMMEVKTSAKKEGEHYVLNGTKSFVINGTEADLFLVQATTDGTKEGITCFVVEKGAAGLKVGEKEDLLGMRAAGVCQVTFDNCRVSPEHLIGGEGQGQEIAIHARSLACLGIAAMAVGISQAASDAALRYSQERKQFGQPICSFHMIQSMLVQMASETESARLMVYKTAWLLEQGQNITKEASMTKMLACDLAVKTTINAVQVHGGYGYTKEYSLERFLRDAKVAQLIEGTSEEQKMIIARQLLKV